MGFDLQSILSQYDKQNFSLYSEYINPQLVRVLRSIGFDKFYTHGRGAYLYDADGNEYLDFLSGFGVFALGRSHPAIKKALHEALDADLPSLIQLDAALLPGVAAKTLLEHCHEGMQRVFFTNSGAESVEAAIKFARAATQREKILYADHAFHGLTYGALSANGGQDFKTGFGPFLPGFTQVPFGDIKFVATELKKKDVAAVLLEPIQGKGVNMASLEYFSELSALCKEAGTLLIIDEVQTGLGRTGKLWAHEHYGLHPDIITVSKALSGGFMPVGAMICSKEISNSVYSSMDRAVVHSSTFKNNQLAMVAVLATLNTITEENLVENARLTGLAFEKALAPLVEKYELLQEVRGLGLMIGFEFGKPKSFALKTKFQLLEKARTGLFSQLIVGPLFTRHKILTQVAGDAMNVVKILPPLVVGQKEVDRFTEALDDVLSIAHKGNRLIFDFSSTLLKGTLKSKK